MNVKINEHTLEMLNQNDAGNPFSGKLRVRVCGILEQKNKILLVKHHNLGPAGYLWIPPGGGVEFGDSLQDTLKKEFLEETHLKIEVGELLFVNEFIGLPYHAIELFFQVKYISGTLAVGMDPELPKEEQIISDVKYLSQKEIEELPSNAIHNVFNSTGKRDKITDLKGLFTFKH